MKRWKWRTTQRGGLLAWVETVVHLQVGNSTASVGMDNEVAFDVREFILIVRHSWHLHQNTRTRPSDSSKGHSVSVYRPHTFDEAC